MEASSERTSGQVRLALMLILGVAASAACVVTLMLWKAPAASGQEEPSPTGANFVVRCPFSHREKVDPIVTPGGTAFHMHDFFGNKTTSANSTLESLRAAASRTDHGTTCEPRPANTFGDTAAYWIPKISWKDSRGTTALKASQTFFYYRAGLKDPAIVKPQPPGLKIVTVQGQNVQWRCFGGAFSPTPPTRCSNGKLVLRIFFPDCLAVNSSGQPLTDTAEDPVRFPANDHRSHMVDAVQPPDGGKATCPPSHPYPVPRLQTNFQFPMPTTSGKVKLSSGEYSTMHADFFNAWQVGALEDLVKRCINAGPFTTTNPKPQDCL
jgi:Domain of unknown function (DUF1996)